MWNCLIFFRGWYSSVWLQIFRVFSKIQWRFLRGISGKNCFGRIFQKFCANQCYPLPKLVDFRPTFCNFTLRLYCVKKITQVISYFVSTQVRRHVHKQITKEYTEKESQDVLFSENQFCSFSVWDLLRLLLWYFCLKYLPNIRHCVFWVLLKNWASESSQKIGNKFDHYCQGWKKGSFVCETVWFFSWLNTHLFDLKFLAFNPKFSGDSYMEFQEKIVSGAFFRNFVQTKAILYQNLRNFTLLSAILFWVRIALKKFTQVLSDIVCTQVRRHVHKQITKKDMGKKIQDVLFSENLFTLGLGLTTPYSLGILVWNFYQTFITMSIEFWMRF